MIQVINVMMQVTVYIAWEDGVFRKCTLVYLENCQFNGANQDHFYCKTMHCYTSEPFICFERK